MNSTDLLLMVNNNREYNPVRTNIVGMYITEVLFVSVAHVQRAKRSEKRCLRPSQRTKQASVTTNSASVESETA